MSKKSPQETSVERLQSNAKEIAKHFSDDVQELKETLIAGAPVIRVTDEMADVY